MSGRELFGLDIAGIVMEALSGQLRAGTLRREVPGDRVQSSLAAGRQRVTQQYPFQGLSLYERVTELGRWPQKGTVVEGQRRVLILARSIDVVPAAGDVLELDGERLVVEGVSDDPAQATYTCVVRD